MCEFSIDWLRGDVQHDDAGAGAVSPRRILVECSPRTYGPPRERGRRTRESAREFWDAPAGTPGARTGRALRMPLMLKVAPGSAEAVSLITTISTYWRSSKGVDGWDEVAARAQS